MKGRELLIIRRMQAIAMGFHLHIPKWQNRKIIPNVDKDLRRWENHALLVLV